ncbi:xanthine dehydrogenase [Arthrobacter sp. Leaf141]|uniref:XdhC family protein n=1 Tax=Arthrobacter sp. Leaf141 TaxID=1736273 RepID=UPI0006F9FFFA|nr:XdhC/CoxI family protein [Arthrobacter sp. Leaf141]KQQ93603.1 xanthine dehydrogenase [Arthrobacter sp. Leaf141]
MLDLIPSLRGWLPTVASGPFAVATIVAATGSVPRPVGTSMLVAGSGSILGSLSGGCVEGAVVALAMAAMDAAGPRRQRFGFSSADAFAAGLTCGGELDIHVEPVSAVDPGGMAACQPLRTALVALAATGPDQPVGLVRRLAVPGRPGQAVVVSNPGEASAVLPGLAELCNQQDRRAGAWPAPLAQAAALLRRGGAGLVGLTQAGSCPPELHSQEPASAVLLVESRIAAPRMLVFGANDFGAALLPAAKLLGYHVTLVDARPAFAAQPRFASADQVVAQWPHRYLADEAAAGRLDGRTVAAVLSHDPKFDLPLLGAALALDLAYVGAMGSRRSHLQRVDDLLGAGIPAHRIARLHSPIGLDLGAETPAEVAVSITAELIAARSRAATGMPLREASGPIHHLPAASAAPMTQQEIAWT